MDSNIDPRIDKELYEGLLNDTFPGVTMYVRDTNLPEACVRQYVPGRILKEPKHTAASKRVMGMQTKHRITILSNHMIDCCAFDQGENWCRYVAWSNGHFKVLDVYEYKGKVQILLLHLPDDVRWKLFQNLEIVNMTAWLIDHSRRRFEAKAFEKVIPELSTPAWMVQCAEPVGMDIYGNLYDIETILEDQLLDVCNGNFRDFYHKFRYIHDRELLEKYIKAELSEEDTGAIVYGILNANKEMAFRLVRLASLRNNSLHLGKIIADQNIVVRLGQALRSKTLELRHVAFDEALHQSYVDLNDENSEKEDEEIRKIRAMTALDPCRLLLFPDVLIVNLVKDGVAAEEVHVHSSKIADNLLVGEVWSEPKGNFGVHIGDTVRFSVCGKNGVVLCVAQLEDLDDSLDFDGILNKIQSGFTGNITEDIFYLNAQILKYSGHMKGKEIAEACRAWIDGLTAEKEKQDAEERLRMETARAKEALRDAQTHILQQDRQEALQILAALVKRVEELPLFEEDDGCERFEFQDDIQERLYEIIYKPKRRIQRIEFPYTEIYLQYGQLLLEMGRHEEAKVVLEKGLGWNPVDTRLHFQYIETFKATGDWEVYLNLTKAVFPIAYHSEDIGRCYRNLSCYFAEKSLWNVAEICCILRMQFEKANKQMVMEIHDIRKKTGRHDHRAYSKEEVRRYGMKYNFPVTADTGIVALAFGNSQYYLNQGEMEKAGDWLRTVYDLVPNENVYHLYELL